MDKFVTALVILVAAITYATWEPTDPHLLNPINIITDSPLIEKYLQEHKDALGPDYNGYRGHLYRVLSYTLHFLNGDETQLKPIAAALVYHDIGLWTDNKLDYLEPSSDRAKKELSKEFSTEELQLIHDIIYWHHKITAFQGKHEEVVNAVRKADWIDATKGVISKGMPRNHIATVQDSIPNAGFHQTLLELGPRLRGWNVYKIVTELGSILKW